TGTVPTGSTGVAGIATCEWTPDPALPTQQLTAKLENTPANQTIEKPDSVQFTANVRAADTGSCCCVTVGAEGDFRTLKDAIATLIKNPKVLDICLCLLAGDHQLNDYLEISGEQLSVRIVGCGSCSRLHLSGGAGLFAHSLLSFTLS